MTAMPAIVFDTLEYAAELKKAGFSAQQAEGQARAQAKIISALIEDKLATKDDLKALKDELLEKLASKEELYSVKEELTEKILTVREELTEKILTSKKDLEEKILLLRQELKEDLSHVATNERVSRLEVRVDNLEKLVVRFGSLLSVLMATGFVILGLLIKLH